MVNKPKISVIMPTYNGAGFIKHSIDSVLSQTYKDFELIIINDGSTDNTEEIIRRYRDKRIVYLEDERNLGVSKARNIGLRRCLGEYIAYCDHDDIYYPNHLEALSDFLNSHPKIGLVYADSIVRFSHHKIKPKIIYSVDFDKYKLEIANFITPCEVMHRSACLEKAGFFDENGAIKAGSGEDWDMWLRIADDFPCLHIKKALGEIVFHGKNRSFDVKFEAAYEHVFKKRLKRLKAKRKRIQYIRNCSISIINILLYSQSFKAAYKMAEQFYRIAKIPESEACLGLCNLTRGNFKTAIRNFQNLMRGINKNDYAADYFYRYNSYLIATALARAFSATGHFRKAETQLKDALALAEEHNTSSRGFPDVNLQNIKTSLSFLYLKFGLDKRALKLSAQCSESFMHKIKGLFYFKQKLYRKAVAELQKSIRLDRIAIEKLINSWIIQNHFIELSLNYYNLGLAYFRLKDFDMAKNTFQEAIRINPNLAYLCRALENTGSKR